MLPNHRPGELEGTPERVGRTGTHVVQPAQETIVLDDSDDGNMEEPSTPAAAEIIVTDIEVDENDRISWIDEFDLNFTETMNPEIPLMVHSKFTWRFRDLLWSSLIVIKLSENNVGVFLGWNEPSSVPPTFSIKLAFQYDLLDNNNRVLCKGKMVESNVYRRPENTSERLDCGNWHTFPGFDAHRFFEMAKAEGFRGPLTVRMSLNIHEIVGNSAPPPRYNSKLATGMVGLENLGATCYLNSLLQMLFHLNAFRKLVYDIPQSDEEMHNSTTLALQSVFTNLQYLPHEVTTKDLTAAFGWTSAEAFMQQDIQEMLRVLLDKLEEKMKGTPLDGSVQKLFAGKVRSYIQCVNVNFASNREEDFYDIQLDVKGCRDVKESFKKYVEIEMLEGENQYDAGVHGKQDARKGVIFTQFPPVLTIHLKRFDFDFQTMGFKKIHDYFQFPTVLDIDEFLAPDCPPESCAVRNRYILHSVLVHSGDVGGGHYYAYIRPSTDINCQDVYTVKEVDDAVSENAAADGRYAPNSGQWFKFNDETVLRVDQREAVKSCYGRRPDGQGFARGFTMSSAYMLAYVREADSPNIMQPVHDHDIPVALRERLATENLLKKQRERKALRDRTITTFSYITEDEVRKFSNYGRNSDFIDDDSFQSMEVFMDSYFIGVHLKIAQRLNVSPYKIRIWLIEKVSHEKTKPQYLRVTSQVSFAEYHKKVDMDSYYYVQIVENDNQLNSVGDLESMEGNADDASGTHVGTPIDPETKFLQYLKAIQLKFDTIRDDVRSELSKLPHSTIDDDEDLLQACGLGLGNKIFFDTKEVSPEYMKSVLLAMRTLAVDAAKLCVQYLGTSEVNETEEDDPTLVFLKVFDPHGRLDSDNDVQTKPSRQRFYGEDRIPSQLSGETVGLDNATFYIKSRPEIHAMKYLGSMSVKLSDPLQLAYDEARRLVAEVYNKSPSIFDGVKLYCLEAPLVCERIHLREENEDVNFSSLYVDSGSLILVINLGLGVVDPATASPSIIHPLDEQCYASPESWMRFQSNKRYITVIPFESRDMKILYNRVVQEAMDNHRKQRSQSIGSDIGSPDKTGGRDRKRKRSDSQTTPSAGLSSAVHHKIVHGLDMEVPIYAKVSEFLAYLGHEIGIEYDNLAVTVTSYFEDDPMEVASQSMFRSCRDAGNFLDLTAGKKINNRIKRWIIFYRILPFSLQTSHGHDIRDSHRLVHVLLVDERLRFWRTLFLDHVYRQKMGQAIMDGSLDASTLMKFRKVNNYEKLMLTAGQQDDENGSTNNHANEAVRLQKLWSTDQLELLDEIKRVFDQLTWPAFRENRFDLPEVGSLHLQVNNSGSDSFIQLLRQAIGMPVNLDVVPSYAENYRLDEPQLVPRVDRRTMQGPFSSNPSGDEGDSDDDMADNSAPELEERLMYHELPLGRYLGGVKYPLVSEVLTTTADSSVNAGICPILPLAVCIVRRFIIEAVHLPHHAALGPPDVGYWPELKVPSATYHHVAVQCIEPDDLLFMHNRHPTIKSMTITVFNFTLLGNAVSVCSPTLYSGPFLSYVREDDTYETVVQRLAKISGDAQLYKLRLAVVTEKFTADFVPKPATLVPSHASTSSLPTSEGTNQTNGHDQLLGHGRGLETAETVPLITELHGCTGILPTDNGLLSNGLTDGERGEDDVNSTTGVVDQEAEGSIGMDVEDDPSLAADMRKDSDTLFDDTGKENMLIGPQLLLDSVDQNADESQKPSPSGQNGGKAALSIYQRLAQHYPHFVDHSFSEAYDIMLLMIQSQRLRSGSNYKTAIPAFGIQRSAAEVQSLQSNTNPLLADSADRRQVFKTGIRIV